MGLGKKIHKLWLRVNDYKEYDSKYSSWQIYKILYKNNLGNFCYEKNVKQDEKRPYIIGFSHKGKKIDYCFGGETDFNFSKKNVSVLHRSRYEHFKELLKRDLDGEPILDIYLTMLDECCERYHSQDNISLMLKIGNMQGVKGVIGTDRIDVFLLVVDLYYKGINLIQNHSTYENIDAIPEFLSLFDDVYDYAETMYHIDRKLTRKLIESGKKPIDSASRVIEYLGYANQFWEQKGEYIEKNIGSSIG